MIGHKVALGAAHLAAFQLSGKVLDMVSVVVLARMLVPEDFGVVALATSAMLVAATVTELPVIDVLVQRKVLEAKDIDAAFTLNFLRGIVVLALLVALAFPLAIVYSDERMASAVFVLAAVPFLKSLESPAIVHSLRRIDYSPTANILLVGKIVGNLSSIILALLWQSYWALILGLVISAGVSTIYSYLLCPYRPAIRFAGVGLILRFAGWVTASRVVFTLNQQGDRFFIGYILGKAPLGQYAMGSEIASMATYALATPALRPIFSAMSRIQSDVVRLRAAYIQSQQAVMMLILPFGVVVAAVAADLVPLLLGEGWEMVVPLIWWLAPVIALQMMAIPVQALAMAQGKPRMLTVRETIALVLRLPTTLVSAWFFGFLGAVIARALTGIIVILMNLFIARSLIGVSLATQIFGCWRSILSATLMAAAVLLSGRMVPVPESSLLQFLRTFGMIISGLSLYGALHLCLWLAAGRPEGPETFAIGMTKSKSKV